MSEATFEAVESEAYESAGEGAYEGEATGEGTYEGEALGEAGYEAYSEDARSDARRRARQRQIMLARQQQARLRRPQPPPRPVVTGPTPAVRAVRSEVRSLDLDTKVALDSLRNRLNEANRLAYRNAWAAEASAAASQALDSFGPGLEPHDWARAIIRGAPTLLLAPGKRRRPGVEGVLFDPRVAGGALVAAIWAVGHFRSQAHGVASVQVQYDGNPLVIGGDSATLTAVALDKAGNAVPNVTFTYSPPTTYFSYNVTAPGVVTLTGQNAGTSWFAVTANGKTNGVFVTVTP